LFENDLKCVIDKETGEIKEIDLFIAILKNRQLTYSLELVNRKCTPLDAGTRGMLNGLTREYDRMIMCEGPCHAADLARSANKS